jgi:transcription antitermination factor NusG
VNSKISTALRWDPNGGAIANSMAESGAVEGEAIRWYAIRTRSRFEKKVECLLRPRGTETFLPLLKAVHRWSDRDKAIQAPLFHGYVFVRLRCTREQCLSILKTSGVLGFAGPGGRPSPIPDRDIEALQRLLKIKTPCTILPFLHQGQRVRIRGGVLDGVVGTLDSNNGKHLVVSIACIQRAVSVRIEGYEVEVA